MGGAIAPPVGLPTKMATLATLLIIKAFLINIKAYYYKYITKALEPISGRVDRASAIEAVDTGSIPGPVKPNTIIIGIHSFPAWRSAIKGTVWSLHRVW